MKFDGLVLSGGGVRGIGTLGILSYYYDEKMLDLDHLTDLAGTSIGSVICALLCCGYIPSEIFQRVCEIEKFFPDPINIFKMLEAKGILSIDYFINIIGNLIMEKLGKIPTLSELKKLSKKNLMIAVTNTTYHRAEYLRAETNPDMSVLDAIGMSCCLPAIFSSIKYKDSYYIDGGASDNFPVCAIDNYRTKNILGVVVSGSNIKHNDGILQYLHNVITTPIEIITELRTANLGDRVTLIRYNYDNAQFLGLGISVETKMDMFLMGYNDAKTENLSIMLDIPEWSDVIWAEKRYDSTFDGW